MLSILKTRSGHELSSLGLAGNPEGIPACVSEALKAGINAYFFYNLTFEYMVDGLRQVAADQRDTLFFSTGTEERDTGVVTDYFEQVREALKTEVLDAFFCEYVAPGDDLEEVLAVLEELHRWKALGKIRFIGASVHDRDLASQLIELGRIDVLMLRYNMAHRKSEETVLPAAQRRGIPVISFTNTRWGSLLKGHKKWPLPVPKAADCYRFVLRHPAVKVAWTAPASPAELRANLPVLAAPRMTGDEVAQWKTYGDLIYGDGKDAFETRWP
jgi:predicted aldo/keto reductase-like oxidoreductase